MNKHLPRLDSLRGVAALMVAGFHAGLNGGSNPASALIAWFLSFFFDGRTGVCIFFVLSGLVLGMSLRRSGRLTPATYFHFCGRRFFRLFPAYFISTFFYLALFLVLRWCLQNRTAAGSGWCDYYQTVPVSLPALFGNFCFLDQHLNKASWTLKVEAQAAFALPLLHFLSLRFRGPGRGVVLALLIAISFVCCEEWPTKYTRIFLYLFYLGYLLPGALDALQKWPITRRFLQGIPIIGMALILLALSHLFPGQGLGRATGILLASSGAALLLASVLHASAHPIYAILDRPAVKFLGAISYSFYLFNLFTVDLTQRMFSWVLGINPEKLAIGWWLVFPVSVLFGVVLSTLCFYLVERPCVRLSGHFLPTIGKVSPAIEARVISTPS